MKFPFLIGKVRTFSFVKFLAYLINFSKKFPFLIGKVRTKELDKAFGTSL